jgi:hypothetical protein
MGKRDEDWKGGVEGLIQDVLGGFMSKSEDHAHGNGVVEFGVRIRHAGLIGGGEEWEFSVPARSAPEVPRIAWAVSRMLMGLYGATLGQAYWPRECPTSVIDVSERGVMGVVYDPRDAGKRGVRDGEEDKEL